MPIRMRPGADVVSGAEKERFTETFEEWYAATKDYGGTREEYDRLWAHYHPEVIRSAWIVEHEVDGQWVPAWDWCRVQETEARAIVEMCYQFEGDGGSAALRVREYVPREPESPSSAQACDGIPRWAAS